MKSKVRLLCNLFIKTTLVCLISESGFSDTKYKDKFVTAVPSPVNFMLNHKKAGLMLEQTMLGIFSHGFDHLPIETAHSETHQQLGKTLSELSLDLKSLLYGEDSILFVPDPDKLNIWTLDDLNAGQFFALPNASGTNGIDAVVDLFEKRAHYIQVFSEALESLTLNTMAPRMHLYPGYLRALYYSHTSVGAGYIVFQSLKCKNESIRLCQIQKSLWGGVLDKVLESNIHSIQNLEDRLSNFDEELSAEAIQRLSIIQKLAALSRQASEGSFDAIRFRKLLTEIAGQGQGGSSTESYRSLASSILAYEEILAFKEAYARLSVYEGDFSEAVYVGMSEKIQPQFQIEINSMLRAIQNYALETEMEEF